MTKIKAYVDQIDDEIAGAKEYAESYVEYKAKGNSSRAEKYKKMAMAEIEHAMMLHDIATEDIEELKKVYKAPAEMQEVWDKSHKIYVEHIAWIKQMLAM